MMNKRRAYIWIILLLIVCCSFILLVNPMIRYRLELFFLNHSEDTVKVIKTNIFQDSSSDAYILPESEFLKKYECEQNVVRCNLQDLEFSQDNIYVLKFKMKSQNSAAQVNVNFGEAYTYFVTTEWREYYYSCADASAITELSMEVDSGTSAAVYLTDVSVAEYYPDNLTGEERLNGSYILNPVTTEIAENDNTVGAGATMDLIGDGRYIYSVGEGSLTITEVEEGGFSRISKIGGLGEVRHIEWISDELVAVAARENGVWLINISDKENPYIVSCYTALERANDVSFSGNLMFVASRYYGIEAVDISNPENPVFINKFANGKECYRCTVYGQYCFVSCWNTREVEIYDVSEISEVVLVASLNVDGNCGETYVDGNYLYVAAGYQAKNLCSQPGAAGYGTGNGMSIFDISDIGDPKWCSTVKADGSLRGSGYDDWSLSVINGYAYLTDSFDGVYIYDVSDVKNPLRVQHITVPVYNDSAAYVDYSQKNNVSFPYDAAEYIVSPAMGIYVGDKMIYIGCNFTDIHYYAFDGALPEEYRLEQPFDFDTAVKETKNEGDMNYYFLGYDVFAVTDLGESYAIGTDQGLILADSSLNELDIYETERAVKDVAVTVDGYIVTAEQDGVGIYCVKNEKILRCSYIQSEVKIHNVFSLGVTGDGNYVIVQASWRKIEAVDIHDKYRPETVKQFIDENGEVIAKEQLPSVGLMYYRDIVSGTADGCVGVIGMDKIIWFESEDQSLKVRNIYKNEFYNESNGIAAEDGSGLVFVVCEGGYVYYELSDVGETVDFNELPVYSVEDAFLQGLCSVRDDIMVICNLKMGHIWILDIQNYDKPTLLVRCDVAGTPNIPLIQEGFVLVPSRHDGLIKLYL